MTPMPTEVSALLTPAETTTPPPAPRHRPEAGELFPFVLPWDDASDSVANVSAWNPAPAGRNGFVIMKDGHLWEPSAGEGPSARLSQTPDPASPRRLRLLGVNLAFTANFPTKEDAPLIAARMAKFGINCVRFHHMDYHPAPGGIFQEDMKTLDPANLDLLDFFFAELKRRGIYADINLHVSRTFPGFPPKWPGSDSFHKGVDQFQPELIQMQKDYARDLLNHVNPYTGVRYLDEPGVALVEIDNETGLMFEWSQKKLDNLPEPFAGELNKQWTRWLAGKYPATDAPQPMGPPAWGVEDVPLGENLLSPLTAPFPEGNPTGAWGLEHHEGAKATLSEVPDPTDPAAKPWTQIDLAQPGTAAWHVQISHGGLKLEAGQPYTLQFQVQASAGVKDLGLTLMQAHEPWDQFSNVTAPITGQPSTVSVTLIPSQADAEARLVITGLGQLPAGSWVRLRDISLKPGGVKGVDLTNDVLSFRYLKKAEFANATLAQKQDWIAFLWQAEDDYWREMDHYLREDLGVKSLLVGTQASVFSNMSLQSRFPVIDTHAYWHHPHFPGHDWSAKNWTIIQEAMSAREDGGELSKLAVNRVEGHAFIVTEYNHPQPISYAAEAFPLLAAMAAWQDWDGIFPFAYSHTNNWKEGYSRGFFDIKQDPLKMATLPMVAALFLRGDMIAPTAKVVGPVPPSAFRNAMMGGSTVVDATNFGAEYADVVRERLYTKLGDAGPPAEMAPVNGSEPTPAPAPPADPTPAANAPLPLFRYVKPPKGEHAVALVTSPRSKALIGHTRGAEFDLGDGVKVSGVDTRLPEDWGIVTLSQMTGNSVVSSGRILLLAMSDQENTDQKWVDEKAKTSVANNWGKAPSRVECIAARITLPLPKDNVQVWSLDERGQPLEALTIGGNETSAVIELKPEYGTIWYEVIVQ